MKWLLRCGVVALGLFLVVSNAEESALGQKPELGELLDWAQQYDKADRDAWIVKFEEQSRSTLFKGDEGTDAPSSGRLWVRADTGAITRTEHVIQQPFVSASFVTDFVPSDRFGVNVPSKLFEEYRRPDSTLSGTATYSNVRQFSVSVGEETPVGKAR